MDVGVIRHPSGTAPGSQCSVLAGVVDAAGCRFQGGTPDNVASGVRIVFRSDGAFTTRAQIGARVSARVEGIDTDRQAQSHSIPLPGGRGTVNTVTVRIELLEAIAPVPLETVHLMRCSFSRIGRRDEPER